MFRPVISTYGFLNLTNPHQCDLYNSSNYLVVPAKPDYFDYSEGILTENTTVYQDDKVVILKREQ